jgi:hypothetical protein
MKRFSISNKTSGVTQTAGVAASLSKIFEYVVPPSSTFYLTPDAVVMLKDKNATETADASQVQIQRIKADGSGVELVGGDFSYGDAKFSQDDRIQFRPLKGGNESWVFEGSSIIRILCNSDQTLATATTFIFIRGWINP